MSKRTFDLLLSIPLLAAAIPVMALVIAVAQVMGDRGPVLYRALRIGEGGRAFEVLKLRTMRVGDDGPRVTRWDDPRITPLGRIVRRFKLDELPQLVNVVRGEMSMVGPRPEDPSYVDWADPQHNEVFRARPGITGVAQLRYAREAELLVGGDFERVYRTEILPAKVKLDQWYLQHQSRRLDARIVLATAWGVIGTPRIGRWIPRLPV